MSSVHIEELGQIDLNALVALDALLSEQSVTRAAQRIGVSQSAMSHTLNRLRNMLGDQLLVRTKGGMMPTPRAEALSMDLRSGLTSLSRAVSEPEAFDPKTSERKFRVVSPDLFDLLVLPRLLSRLGSSAPNIDLAVIPHPRVLSDALETGEVDLAVVPVLLGKEGFGVTLSPELRRKTLFRDHFQCFLRHGHPAVGKGRPLTLKKYVSLTHLLVSPSGGGTGVVDGTLQQKGHSRRVGLQVPHFASALAIAAQSDLVFTAPRSLARCAPTGALDAHKLPFSFPEHAITIVWHERFSSDPSHQWLREELAAAATTAASE